MKLPNLALLLTAALSLAACSTTQTLRVPPSTPVSLPPLPQAIDQTPAQLPPLTDGHVGAIIDDDMTIVKLYGDVAVRYEALRQFYRCVRSQVNTHQAPEYCSAK